MVENCPVGQAGSNAAITDPSARAVAQMCTLCMGGATGSTSGSSSAGAAEGAEQVNDVGSALVQQVQPLLATFCSNTTVRNTLGEALRQEITSLIPSVQNQNSGQKRRQRQAAAMDLAHLARLLTCCLDAHTVRI